MIEFVCAAQHLNEFLLPTNVAEKAKSRKCRRCGRLAKRIDSVTAGQSPDFAIAKDYERRKGQEPPIFGSASFPNTPRPGRE